MEKMTKSHIPKSFGAFSPTGHLVLAFRDDTYAAAARDRLLRTGFHEDDTTYYRHDEWISEFERQRSEVAQALQIGQEAAKTDHYLELAEQGCGFLVVYAPRDSEARRVIRLVRRFKLLLAEKYNRFTLVEMV